MNKRLQFFLAAFFFFTSQIAFACVSNPTGTVVSDDGNAPASCDYDVTVCVNFTTDANRVIFEVESSSGAVQSQNKGLSGALNGVICHTFTFELDCAPEPTFTGTATGVDGPNDCGTVIYPEFSESAPLPVDLVSFKAHLFDNESVIEWVTASEENNDYFEVQYSTNGRDFTMLDIIKGNGTTSELQYYKYTHADPQRGNNYYRLKQVDFDGGFEIFDMAVVKVEGNTDIFTVYPSEVFDRVTLEAPQLNPKDMEISIFNTNGKLIQKAVLNEGAYRISLDVSSLPAGTYFIRYLNEDYEYTSKQFFKMRN